jgi:AcrR family transcriptional regulator
MSDSPPDGRSERAQHRRSVRRRQILDAALRIFADRGYHDTGIADIVAAADVARGTFYLYFPSKRAVFVELLDEICSAIESGIRRVDVSPGAPPAVEQLLHNIRWLLSLPSARPEMLQLLLGEAGRLDEELDRKLDSFHQRMFSLTERSLRTGIAVGLVRPCDPAIAARLAVGSLKELLLSLLLRQDLPGADIDQIAMQLVEFTASGLLHPQFGHQRLP